MKSNLEQQVEVNKSLLEQQSTYRIKYDDTIKVNQDAQQRQKDLITEIEQLHNAILSISPTKQLVVVDNIGKPPMSPQPIAKHHSSTATASAPTLLSSTPPPQMITSRTMSVPTAAALKQGVGFPLNTLRKDETGRILSTQCPINVAPLVRSDELLNECGICKKCNDQHLVVKCDTCHLYYHLGCLNPPLTRHPKKSKLYAWQCSECDKSDNSGDENVLMIPKGPRRSRNIRYSKDGIISDLHDSFGSEKSLINLSSPTSPIPHRIPNGDELLDFATAIAPTLIDMQQPPDIKASTPKTEAKKKAPKRRDSIIIMPAKLKIPTKRGRKKKEVVKEEAPQETKPIEPQVTPAIVENHHQESQEAPSVTSESTQNKPKRGRPKKSASQNNTSDQSVDLTVKSDTSGLLDLSQYRAFANIPNTIPTYPVEVTSNAKIEDIKADPTITQSSSVVHASLTSGTLSSDLLSDIGEKLTNGDASVAHSLTDPAMVHKHKKRKSHKRRHSHSPSSRQSSSSGKKHKRKHKHKDHENPMSLNNEHRPVDDQVSTLSSIEQPRIKIKFRAILQNSGGDMPPKFLWHVPSEAEDAAGVNSKVRN